MRTTATVVLGGLALLLLVANPAAAQEEAHAHIGHVMEAFPPTPDGGGLLPTALEEASIAAQHAAFAARDLDDLDNIQTHAAHVLHAVDPDEIDGGPGLGFGVRQAAQGVADHIGAAASSDGASDNVQVHAEHVATSARNTVERAERIVELVREIQAATTAEEAAPLAEELVELTEILTTGKDATGDGQVSWRQGEGGLAQAEQHMRLMMDGEGLG